MNKNELTNYLDSIYEAVDKSKFGPMRIITPEGVEAYSSTAFDIYKTVLIGISPKSMSVEEPKEDWEK